MTNVAREEQEEAELQEGLTVMSLERIETKARGVQLLNRTARGAAWKGGKVGREKWNSLGSGLPCPSFSSEQCTHGASAKVHPLKKATKQRRKS